VRSEQRSEQKDSSTQTASGVPGVQSNMGKAPSAGTSVNGGGSKSDETLNYEVSRSSAKIIEPVGTLTKLSVAILVDGKYEAGAPAKAGQAAKPRYTPRSQEELQKIEALVKSAVGYNGERGDQLTVVNVPFQDTEEEAAAPPQWWQQPAAMELGKNGLLGLAFLALLLFVIRPMMKMLAPPKKSAKEAFVPLDAEEERQEQIEGKHHTQIPQLGGVPLVSQMDLIEIVKKDPYQTAQILQNWLMQKE
jgi:flagellar M-ring protein FliF